MFGHDDIAEHDEALALPGFFQKLEQQITAAARVQERTTAITTTGDKVQIAATIVAFESAGHEGESGTVDTALSVTVDTPTLSQRTRKDGAPSEFCPVAEGWATRQGLIYPMKSRVVQAMLGDVKATGATGAAGAAVSADLALLQGLALELHQLATGQCH
jgi:hypothetical protein